MRDAVDWLTEINSINYVMIGGRSRFFIDLKLYSDESSYAVPLAFDLAECSLRTVTCSRFPATCILCVSFLYLDNLLYI